MHEQNFIYRFSYLDFKKGAWYTRNFEITDPEEQI